MASRQFRIVVVSHGGLAAALVSTAGLILGGTEGVDALGMSPEETPESLASRLRAAIARDTAPTLILTDLRGGSPHNIASVMARDGIRSVSGVNLPMLLEALGTNEPLSDPVVERLASAARDGIAPGPVPEVDAASAPPAPS